jgi:hypothetical protein
MSLSEVARVTNLLDSLESAQALAAKTKEGQDS